MGLPQGHVTEAGIARTAQLKALGNGVVPQQAALAVATLLDVTEDEVRHYERVYAGLKSTGYEDAP